MILTSKRKILVVKTTTKKAIITYLKDLPMKKLLAIRYSKSKPNSILKI